MNIFEKLQNMRVELQQKNIKKSGKNKFAGYDYYELSDILPPINELQSQYKTCSFISYNKEEATLTIVNAEKADEQITFTSPMAELTLKGTHPIQNLGGIETYQRRYLYMTAFEIVENDYFDSVQGKDQKPQPQPKQKAKTTALSPETTNELNKLILDYSEKAGKAVADITKELTELVKTPLRQIDTQQAEKLLAYLKSNIEKD